MLHFLHSRLAEKDLPWRVVRREEGEKKEEGEGVEEKGKKVNGSGTQENVAYPNRRIHH